MRIIAGTAGRRRIEVPGKVARPTTDRVREAMFSILGPAIEGARVLDLFAGSGALGLEALSRGAVSADFIEQDRKAGSVISKNLASTGLQGGRVLRRDVFAFIRAAGSSHYDFIFADPPYTKFPWEDDLATRLLDSGLDSFLVEGGRLVLEVSSDHLPKHDWEEIERRRYGATSLLFLRPATVNQGTRP